jgi:carbonic anhydrase
MNAQEALEKLQKGNQRFVADKLEHPRTDSEHRQQLQDGQEPFAVVVCCSDSRVVPEHIFDCGLGDIFVIRVAGNIIDDPVLGSIEYATVHLKTSLVVVLGHESCGAVTAAVDGSKTDMHIDDLVRLIRPAVEKVPEDADDRVDQAIRTHAEMGAEALRTSQPVLRDQVNDGDVVVRAAYYHLRDGSVEFLEDK